MATYKANRKKVSNAAKRKAVMQSNHWTKEEYRKHYDIFKNKLRAYESYRRAHGAKVETQSPIELLYKQAKAKQREGAGYRPSREMQRIESFSAVSITKGRKLAQDFESKYSKNRAKAFAESTAAQFAGLIERSRTAADIAILIEDPVKREEALKALAEHIHAKQTSSGAVFADGETYGSDDAGDDFDYSEWLEE